MKTTVYQVVTEAGGWGTYYRVQRKTWRGWKDAFYRSFSTQLAAEQYIDALSTEGTVVAVKVVTEHKWPHITTMAVDWPRPR